MQSANILVIEDNPEDSQLLDKLLSNEGYNVYMVDNGEEAVKVLKSKSINVILTEMRMPGMNGVDITRLALSRNKTISVVVMTAYSFVSTAVEAMEAGAYGYVSKPLNMVEVRIVVKRAFERNLLLSSDERQEQLAEMSVKDGLTGVFNRRFLAAFLKKKILQAEQSNENFSLIMADVDHFKKFNDTQGHLAGDKLLKDLCQLLQETVRDSDVIFRYGGEEFLIYLDRIEKEPARQVAERIRSLVGLYMPTTISLGVGAYPFDGTDVEELVKHTDAAMYYSKENGRNRVTLASPDLTKTE